MYRCRHIRNRVFPCMSTFQWESQLLGNNLGSWIFNQSAGTYHQVRESALLCTVARCLWRRSTQPSLDTYTWLVSAVGDRLGGYRTCHWISLPLDGLVLAAESIKMHEFFVTCAVTSVIYRISSHFECSLCASIRLALVIGVTDRSCNSCLLHITSWMIDVLP